MSRKSHKITGTRTPSPSAGAERSEAEADGEGVRRGRPGRRTAEERTTAVLELLGGKATADQLAFRFGVQPATIEAWHQEALVAIAQSMRQGNSKSPELLALERKYADLEKSFTRVAIKHELLERELSNRPSRPGTSSR